MSLGQLFQMSMVPSIPWQWSNPGCRVLWSRSLNGHPVDEISTSLSIFELLCERVKKDYCLEQMGKIKAAFEIDTKRAREHLYEHLLTSYMDSTPDRVAAAIRAKEGQTEERHWRPF